MIICATARSTSVGGQTGPFKVSVIALMLLSACTSNAERAKAEYEMAKRYGASSDELCKRGQALAEAYLQDQNHDEYLLAKINADLTCNQARLGGL